MNDAYSIVYSSEALNDLKEIKVWKCTKFLLITLLFSI